MDIEQNVEVEQPVAPPPSRPPPRPIYGRLELLTEVRGQGGAQGKDVVIWRPTALEMANIIDATGRERMVRFIGTLCRVTNGSGTYETFSDQQVYSPDLAELGSIVTRLISDADAVDIVGDGINEPIVYDLKRPVTLNPRDPDSAVIRQIEFKAKKLGDMSEFLDAGTFLARYQAFMRGFGQMLGTNMPMADAIINAIDYLDFLVIMTHIAGKLTGPRAAWRKE